MFPRRRWCGVVDVRGDEREHTDDAPHRNHTVKREGEKKLSLEWHWSDIRVLFLFLATYCDWYWQLLRNGYACFGFTS